MPILVLKFVSSNSINVRFKRIHCFTSHEICFIETLKCFTGIESSFNSFEACRIQTIICFYYVNFVSINYVL